jgi:hypothetical protein
MMLTRQFVCCPVVPAKAGTHFDLALDIEEQDGFRLAPE